MLKRMKIVSFLIAIMLTVAVGLFFLSGCTTILNSIKGNGKMVDGEFEVTEHIEKIDISKVTATFEVSNEHSENLTYKIDENLKEHLDISLSNGTLKIASKVDETLGRNTKRVVFNIGANMLENITISGAVTIKGDGSFNANAFKLDVDGAASVDLKLSAETVSVEVDGAADINLSGTANSITISADGAFEIDTKDLICKNATLTFAGAGSCNVYASEKLNVKGDGAYKVRYYGNPASTDIDADGAGSVKKG